MNNSSILKTLQTKEEYFIQFTDEEMAALDIKPHDKFEVLTQDDGSIMLKKFVKLELNLTEFDKETLVFLINESIESQVPVDEVIRKHITSALEKNTKLELNKP